MENLEEDLLSLFLVVYIVSLFATLLVCVVPSLLLRLYVVRQRRAPKGLLAEKFEYADESGRENQLSGIGSDSQESSVAPAPFAEGMHLGVPGVPEEPLVPPENNWCVEEFEAPDFTDSPGNESHVNVGADFGDWRLRQAASVSDVPELRIDVEPEAYPWHTVAATDMFGASTMQDADELPRLSSLAYVSKGPDTPTRREEVDPESDELKLKRIRERLALRRKENATVAKVAPGSPVASPSSNQSRSFPRLQGSSPQVSSNLQAALSKSNAPVANSIHAVQAVPAVRRRDDRDEAQKAEDVQIFKRDLRLARQWADPDADPKDDKEETLNVRVDSEVQPQGERPDGGSPKAIVVRGIKYSVM